MEFKVSTYNGEEFSTTTIFSDIFLTDKDGEKHTFEKATVQGKESTQKFANATLDHVQKLVDILK